MLKQATENIPWGFYSKLIIVSYCFLQAIHWPLFPLYMDIHYHLLTAQGFIASGGYSGWDFWQYAPYGRVHIYPPVFHIILAFFTKVGVDKILLAKYLEMTVPILFLITAWRFIKNNYSERLGFFFLVMFGSSFSFYRSLINHLPATLALIFGIFCLNQLLNNKLIRAALLLTLCFYTHIAVSWFIAISLILFALLDSKYRKPCSVVVLSSIVLSLPFFIKQLMSFKYVAIASLNEKYLCEFKIIDYLLALVGIFISWKLCCKYRLFFGLFLASFIFLKYPYRFFSAEGYLPIIFLSAMLLDNLYDKLRAKSRLFTYSLALIIIFIFSPTVLINRDSNTAKVGLNVYSMDSSIINLIFPERNSRLPLTTLWVPNEYLSAATLIKESSDDNDIIYCDLANVSVCLASLSLRVSANGLLPEVGPAHKFDPISVSRIFIALKHRNPRQLDYIVTKYKLIKIGDNRIFILYKNPAGYSKADIKKSSVSFAAIILIGALFSFLYWQADKINNKILKFI